MDFESVDQYKVGQIKIYKLVMLFFMFLLSNFFNYAFAAGVNDRFYADNPVYKYQNLSGKNVYLLANCVVSRTVNSDDTCIQINRYLQSSKYVHVLIVKYQNQYSLNFSVSVRKYPNDFYINRINGCSFKNIQKVHIYPRLNSNVIENCVSVSILYFLGFDIKALNKELITIDDLDNIMKMYTNNK